MVTASRRHLTTEYASGVDRLLWDMDKRPMPDQDAVHAVISASLAHRQVDALDIGAALTLLLEMRLELDCLEADLLDVALDSGLGFESLAAVLELPDPAAMRSRLAYLISRREVPRATAASSPPTNPPDSGTARAAAQAARRAELAARRAESAARRRQELRTAARGANRADADLAAAHAGEAKIHAGDAAERVATGLLRAADALDACAAKCMEATDADRRPEIMQRAHEYTAASRRYREMAARYLDICKHD